MTGTHTEACTRCGRRFVAIGRVAPPRCPCGGVLATSELPEGLYEIEERRRARTSRVARTIDRREHDLGYGESHGYGPAHGGPSGPGDAPAPRTTAAR